MLYVPRDLSFISTQFLVPNLDGSFYILFNKFTKALSLTSFLIFHYYILLYNIIIRLSIIFCLWEIYIFLKYLLFIYYCLEIILWSSSWNFCNSISNFISNYIISFFCCFLNHSFWRSFKWICSKFFSMIKKFLTVFTA